MLHIKPNIGKIELDKLTLLMLFKLYQQLEQNGVGADSRRKVHITLSGALERALKLHLISTNPIGAVDVPKVKPKRATPLTMEQAAGAVPPGSRHLCSGRVAARLVREIQSPEGCERGRYKVIAVSATAASEWATLERKNPENADYAYQRLSNEPCFMIPLPHSGPAAQRGACLH